MNTIYNKLRSKRRYTRKPTCPNKQGICEYGKCRCDIALKAPKQPLKGIKVNHRLEAKVVDRLREKAKLENDRENEEYLHLAPGSMVRNVDFTRGEHSKHRLIRKRYERQVWVVLALITLTILYLWMK